MNQMWTLYLFLPPPKKEFLKETYKLKKNKPQNDLETIISSL